jgi:NAD-dependent deacetylase
MTACTDIQRARDLLASARSVAVLTGAGISAASGLRTFRGATKEDLPADMRSLWAEFDPQTLATPGAFAADPAKVSRWYDWRRLGCLAAEPSAGHVALAALERAVVRRGGAFLLATQNVDGLHRRAGSSRVVELHGTILVWRCTATGRRVTPGEGAMEAYPTPSPFAEGAWLRPDVVWFGEMLPEAALIAAGEAAVECDVFLSVGTSSVVYPAAGLVRVAKEHGARVIEVNPEPTPLSSTADVVVRASAGAALPGMVGVVEKV